MSLIFGPQSESQIKSNEEIQLNPLINSYRSSPSSFSEALGKQMTVGVAAVFFNDVRFSYGLSNIAMRKSLAGEFAHVLKQTL